MAEGGSGTPRPAAGVGRLDGWKEVAAYLGRSVRTVQRWETLGLPVHRLSLLEKDVVYAFTADIDAWRAVRERAKGSLPTEAAEPAEEEAPRAEPTGRRPRRSRLSLAATFVLAISALPLWLALKRPGAAPNPAAWQLLEDRLRILDDQGRTLGEHRFDVPLRRDSYPEKAGSAVSSREIRIEDLDGDGTREVLFLAYSRDPHQGWLYCLRPDGSIRVRHRPSRRVSYGPEEYAPPFGPSRFVVTAERDGTKSIWLMSHHLWFPAVVEKLTPEGTVVGEYWNNGHIQLLQEATIAGRRLFLVGGTNNELYEASLAVLDYERPSGAAPALSPTWQCDGCPHGRPLAYFTFPQLEIARALDRRPYVTEARVSDGGILTVTVLQAKALLDGGFHSASVFYRIDPALLPMDVVPGDEYRTTHRLLELQGVLKHRFGPADLREMFPIRCWDGNVLRSWDPNATGGQRGGSRSATATVLPPGRSTASPSRFRSRPR